MNRKKSKEEAKKKDPKPTKRDGKEAKKDAKKEAKEAKKVNKDTKKESKRDSKQRKPSFVSRTMERSKKTTKDTEPEFERAKRPNLMKSNSISGGERLFRPSTEQDHATKNVTNLEDHCTKNMTNPEVKTNTLPRMLRRSMYHSEMELPRIDEDDREINRRSGDRLSLTKRVSNLLRDASDRLIGRSAENLSLTRFMLNLADSESLGGFVPLTRSTSVMLPRVL